MKKIKLLFVILILVKNVSGQFIADYKSLSGENIQFNAVQAYGDNYMVAGSEGNKILLCEIDLNGNVLSSKHITVIDESTYPGVMSMIVDSDGSIVLVGYREFTVYTSISFAIKYDFNAGIIKWIKTFENPGSYFHKVIEKGAGGNYIVAGQSFNPPNGEEGILLSLKRNNGDFTIINNSNFNVNSETYYGVVFKEGKYYTCSRYTFATGGSTKLRGCLTKFTNTGTEIFTKAYIRNITTDAARLYASDLVNLNNSLYMSIHGDETSSDVNQDLFLMRSNLNGVATWIKNYDLTNYSEDGGWNGLEVDNNKIFAFGNLNDGTPDNKGKVFIMSLDTTGNLNWAKNYPFETSKTYNHTDAILATNSKLIVVGSLFDDESMLQKGVFMIVDQSDGSLSEGCDINEPVTIINKTKTAYSSSLTPMSNIYSINSPTKINGVSDIYLDLKTCDSIINVRIENKLNSKIYPNPISNNINLEFTYTSDYKIAIYNNSGQQIYNTYFEDADHLTVQSINFPKGLYNIVITDLINNTNITERVVKQ